MFSGSILRLYVKISSITYDPKEETKATMKVFGVLIFGLLFCVVPVLSQNRTFLTNTLDIECQSFKELLKRRSVGMEFHQRLRRLQFCLIPKIIRPPLRQILEMGAMEHLFGCNTSGRNLHNNNHFFYWRACNSF